MPIKTYTEQLEEVQAAITAVLTGAQDVEQSDERVRLADLSALQKREEYLRPLALREQAQGGRTGIPIYTGVPS